MTRTGTRSTYTPGQPVAFSADFPHQWADPVQARHLWTLDLVHFGEPMPLLAAEIWQRHVAPAFNKVSARYCLPIRLAFLHINEYLYTSYQPVSLPPVIALRGLNVLQRIAPKVTLSIQAQVVKRMSQKYLVHVEPILSDLEAHWQNDWLPELHEHVAFWDNFDLDQADLSSLMAHMEESLNRICRVWEIHFALFVPAYLALHLFDEYYHECIPGKDVFAAFLLVQEFNNSFWRAERAIWRLRQQVQTMPEVLKVLFRSHTTSEILAELLHFPEGQIFLAEFKAYLNKYGRRGQRTSGLSETSWIEDPTPAVIHLQATMQQPDRDLDAELEAHSAKRKKLVSQTRQRLQHLPQGKRERFEVLLEAAQTAAYLHEEHHFWIDQQAMYLLRQVFLAVGQHFADGDVIDEPQDIFFLSLDEVRKTAAALPQLKQQESIRKRQAIQAHFRDIPPPDALGTMPLMTPTTDPLYRAVAKVLGLLSPTTTQTSDNPHVLHGFAAAPGIVRGQARVIHALTGADKLQQGEILVAETTLPPWTPLFAIAAAVVTESGGILSHAAVLARAYGIPAVVGVKRVTTSICDGQWIEVNGNDGALQLVAENAKSTNDLVT